MIPIPGRLSVREDQRPTVLSESKQPINASVWHPLQVQILETKLRLCSVVEIRTSFSHPRRYYSGAKFRAKAGYNWTITSWPWARGLDSCALPAWRDFYELVRCDLILHDCSESCHSLISVICPGIAFRDEVWLALISDLLEQIQVKRENVPPTLLSQPSEDRR